MSSTIVGVDTINGGIVGAGWTVVIPFTYPGNIQTAPALPSTNALGSYGVGEGTVSGPHASTDSLCCILSVNLLDNGDIPLGATITSIQAFMRCSGEEFAPLPFGFNGSYGIVFGSGEHVFVQPISTVFDQPWVQPSGPPYTWYHENAISVTNGGDTSFDNTFTLGGIGYQGVSSVITVNPLTSVPLVRDDIFNPSNGHWGMNVAFIALAPWTSPSDLKIYLDQLVFEIEWEPGGIIITGSGGIQLGNEGFLGEGGLEIGEDPAFPTPLVVSADVTGMYTLVPGQHFDRIYTRNTALDQTADVAMPPPTGKTGYVGG